MKAKLQKFLLFPLIISVLLTYFLYLNPMFPKLALLSYDRMVHFDTPAADQFPSKAVIVARDDKTYSYLAEHTKEIGVFNQNDRSLFRWCFAKVLDRLQPMEPAAIGFDFIFQDETVPPEADMEFEKSIQKIRNVSRVVLATKMLEEKMPDNSLNFQMVKPYKRISDLAYSFGAINMPFDDDGTARCSYLWFKGKKVEDPVEYYSFALSLFLAANYSKPENAKFVLDRYPNLMRIPMGSLSDEENGPGNSAEVSTTKNAQGKEPEYQNFKVKYVDSRFCSFAKINHTFWGGTGTIPQIPLYYFLDDKIWEEKKKEIENLVRDNVVMVGPTSLEDQDFVITPWKVESNKRMTGVELHANIYNSLYYRLQIFEISSRVLGLSFFLMMCLSYFVFYFFKPISSTFFLVTIILVLVLGSAMVLHNDRYFFDCLTPSLGLCINFFYVLGIKYFTEQKEKLKLRKVFANYVDTNVITELMKNPDKLKLGGEKRTITILFSDVAGFTTISEALGPEDLVSLLNEYLGTMADIVIESNGLLDKFIGDAVMAFWGAPVPMADHAKRTCQVALRMLKKLGELQKKWEEQKLPRIDIRIGINTGEVIVGNVGSSKRMNYTILGDSVNTAARLEPACKQYGVRTLISDNTMELVKDDFILREVDLVRVKGKFKPTGIYELIAEKSEAASMDLKYLDCFSEALALYKQMKWDEAIAKFHEVYEMKHDKTSKIYIDRCEEFKKDPPSADWDGVYVMTTK
ncbi:MAG: adenylate/guanylate cyclase domain-containing protein [Candidatus Wallbacteria bacterium]|nr:adenylate/guanylate cyclase domain-containing protein [Candidatus Wallbacteria bacterium]